MCSNTSQPQGQATPTTPVTPTLSDRHHFCKLPLNVQKFRGGGVKGSSTVFFKVEGAEPKPSRSSLVDPRVQRHHQAENQAQSRPSWPGHAPLQEQGVITGGGGVGPGGCGQCGGVVSPLQQEVVAQCRVAVGAVGHVQRLRQRLVVGQTNLSITNRWAGSAKASQPMAAGRGRSFTVKV